MYTIHKQPPLIGTFVKFWVYEGSVYSDTYAIGTPGYPMVYNAHEDEWIDAEGSLAPCEGQKNIRYIVYGED